MSFQHWSENIVVAELQDDPAFSDDLVPLQELVTANDSLDVVLDLSAVDYLNSSNIAKLLKLRKIVVGTHRRSLKLCGVGTHVWGLFLVTGLDKVFDFVDNVAEALTGVQMNRT